MTKKMNSSEPRERFRARVHALLPEVDNLDDQEIDHILTSSGIDPEAVIEAAYERLQRRAGRNYLSLGKDPPPELRSAVHQLKPTGSRDRANSVATKAKLAIRSIFETVNKNPVKRTAVIQPAFRNKRKLTDSDRSILAEMQRELDEDDPS